LKFVLDQQYTDGLHTIGRFRILVTTAPRPLALGGLPEAIAQVLAKPADQRSEQEQAALLAHYRAVDPQLQALNAAVQAAQQATPPVDPMLKRLTDAVATSEKQLGNQRLIGAQDLVWALINSPSFLFNR
jgi:hypothetical protein